jgi:hypothetical protein
MPPIHVIPRPGETSVIFNENARPGVALAYSFILSPAAIRPSIVSIVEFHAGYPAASVSKAHTLSARARIVIEVANRFIPAW